MKDAEYFSYASFSRPLSTFLAFWENVECLLEFLHQDIFLSYRSTSSAIPDRGGQVHAWSLKNAKTCLEKECKKLCTLDL